MNHQSLILFRTEVGVATRLAKAGRVAAATDHFAAAVDALVEHDTNEMKFSIDDVLAFRNLLDAVERNRPGRTSR